MFLEIQSIDRQTMSSHSQGTWFTYDTPKKGNAGFQALLDQEMTAGPVVMERPVEQRIPLRGYVDPNFLFESRL